MLDDSHDRILQAWQNQSASPAEISLAQLRRKAKTLQRRVRWRNLLEYAATPLVIGCFAWFLLIFPSWIIRVGCLLVIAATLVVIYELHRRGSARTGPEEMTFQTCLEFHRQELLRQRDLLCSVWIWYLLPFVPGIAVFLVGLYLWTMKLPNAPQHFGAIRTVYAITAVAFALVFVGIGELNAWGARKLQREIDQLNAMAKE